MEHLKPFIIFTIVFCASAVELHRLVNSSSDSRTLYQGPEVIEIINWRQSVCIAARKNISFCDSYLPQQNQLRYMRDLEHLANNHFENKTLNENNKSTSVVENFKNLTVTAQIISSQVVEDIHAEDIERVDIESSQGHENNPQKLNLHLKTPDMVPRPRCRLGHHDPQPIIRVLPRPPAIIVTKVVDSPVTATLIATNCIPDPRIPRCMDYSINQMAGDVHTNPSETSTTTQGPERVTTEQLDTSVSTENTEEATIEELQTSTLAVGSEGATTEQLLTIDSAGDLKEVTTEQLDTSVFTENAEEATTEELQISTLTVGPEGATTEQLLTTESAGDLDEVTTEHYEYVEDVAANPEGVTTEQPHMRARRSIKHKRRSEMKEAIVELLKNLPDVNITGCLRANTTVVANPDFIEIHINISIGPNIHHNKFFFHFTNSTETIPPKDVQGVTSFAEKHEEKTIEVLDIVRLPLLGHLNKAENNEKTTTEEPTTMTSQQTNHAAEEDDLAATEQPSTTTSAGDLEEGTTELLETSMSTGSFQEATTEQLQTSRYAEGYGTATTEQLLTIKSGRDLEEVTVEQSQPIRSGRVFYYDEYVEEVVANPEGLTTKKPHTRARRSIKHKRRSAMKEAIVKLLKNLPDVNVTGHRRTTTTVVTNPDFIEIHINISMGPSVHENKFFFHFMNSSLSNKTENNEKTPIEDYSTTPIVDKMTSVRYTTIMTNQKANQSSEEDDFVPTRPPGFPGLSVNGRDKILSPLSVILQRRPWALLSHM